MVDQQYFTNVWSVINNTIIEDWHSSLLRRHWVLRTHSGSMLHWPNSLQSWAFKTSFKLSREGRGGRSQRTLSHVNVSQICVNKMNEDSTRQTFWSGWCGLRLRWCRQWFGGFALLWFLGTEGRKKTQNSENRVANGKCNLSILKPNWIN